jgi:hypothetical protein
MNLIRINLIYNILKNKDKILSIPNPIIVNNNMQIIYKNSIPEIENLLIVRINFYRNIGIIITDNVIKIKAKKIYDKLKESCNDLSNKFKFSNGCIKFKNRNNFVQRTICGESKSLNESFITLELVKIQSIVVKYNPENVCNEDET